MKKMSRILILIVLSLILFISGCQKVISGTGYVYDKSDGKPIQGATVNAYLGNTSPDAMFTSTLTDTKGFYYVRSRPYSCTGTCPTLYVEIYKSGYQGKSVKSPNHDTTYLAPSH